MKKSNLAAITLALVMSTSHIALAKNTIFIEQVPGTPINNLTTDLPANGTQNDTVYGFATGGNNNAGQINISAATNTAANIQEYGSNNYQQVNTNATNSNIIVGQGNSPEQAAINHYPVSGPVNGNYAITNVSGDSQSAMVFQKGDYNASVANVSGNNAKVFVAQQMDQQANNHIVDPQGNVYMGGNDSLVNAKGKVNVSVNQFNGNVSKVNSTNTDTSGATTNTALISTSNTKFAADRTYNNVDVINQNGSNLSASVKQFAAGALATINQTDSNNSATVDQTLGGGNAQITQAGTGENTTVTQSGVALASVNQTGSGNALTIDQKYGDIPTGNSATVTQSGTNSATVSTAGLSNSVTLTQNGLPNTLGQNAATIAQAGNNNSLAITETGAGNSLQITQKDGNGNSLGAIATGITSSQVVGNNNKVAILEQYNGNQEAVSIYGDRNVLNMNSYGGNTALIMAGQSGAPSNDNQITVNQSNTSGDASQGNLISFGITSGSNGNQVQFSQIGTLNNIGYQLIQPSYIQGSNNQMVIDQNGSGNTAVGVQNGNGNYLGIVQTGSGNKGVITQNGSNMNISLTQSGSKSFSIIQGPDNPSITVHQ